MILTALFKIIELLTVKPNKGSQPARGSNKKDKSNENVSTHPIGASDRDWPDDGRPGVRGGEHLLPSTHFRSDHGFHRRLFFPFNDD